ncbi:MAG: diaminobutyrate acetyltransferase [Limnobacter sp.]|nr:diaminobutyrate acetyltransferase [Limnobacter sp.]
MPDSAVEFTNPVLEDGPFVYDLVAQSKPLDLNSRYFYLVQCGHFSKTCVRACLNGELVGWVSGHLLPEQNNVLFVWQVAVSAQARGMGLAVQMIQWLLAKHPAVRQVHTSITPGNKASWGLFESLARRWGTQITRSDWFHSQQHFQGNHDTEVLVQLSVPARNE